MRSSRRCREQEVESIGKYRTTHVFGQILATSLSTGDYSLAAVRTVALERGEKIELSTG